MYGLTCDEFDALRLRADDRCELCGVRAEDVGPCALNIDHDHALGDAAVRGLLCNRCNRIIGLVEHGARAATPPQARYLANAWHLLHPPSAKPTLRHEERRLLPRIEPEGVSKATLAERQRDAMRELERYTRKHSRQHKSTRFDELLTECLLAGISPRRLADFYGHSRIKRLQVAHAAATSAD